MDENDIDLKEDSLEQGTFDGTQLSDVIEVIINDPGFADPTTTSAKVTNTRQPSPMLNGGGQVTMPQNPNHQPSSGAHRNYPAEIRIIEQPAQKSLRFRYECEGRSAGSIPGASSTPENKKFPEIQIVGCDPSLLKQAVVVVSCVTKDPPYEAHPHNLVGRDNCKDGVCTVHIPPETMRVEFQNLGIQCVKKRDIEKSLSVREKLKVDPFKRGFAHKNQPTSIDLNAVRLCFQVFYMSPDNQNGNRGGKFNALRPVVSNIIYDKKAMSEMTIVKLSDCVTYVDGGKKDIILLCEKVAKEDIEVHFFEENDAGLRVWEDKADFQPTQVHKQTAIWFRAPRYRNIEVTEPVKAFIQLYRPSDRATSEALQFQFLPLDSGRSSYWYKSKKPNYELFNSILVNDSKLLAKRQLNSAKETNNNEDMPSLEFKKCKLDDNVAGVEDNPSAFNEIMEQVAELDEIYSDTHAKLMSEAVDDGSNVAPQREDSFDDSKTYTSLQLAFKNPLSLSIVEPICQDAPVITAVSPQISVAPTPSVAPPPKEDDIPPVIPPKVPILPPKRDHVLETGLPPLPPKRTKKLETYIGGSLTSIQLTGKQADQVLTRSGSMKSQSVSRNSSIKLQRPKSHGELSAPVKNLPPMPKGCSTLPNPKKRGFFSKLFGRKSSRSSVQAPSRDVSVSPSQNSTKSLQVNSNLSKSAGNISTHSSNSVRIRLKDDSPPHIAPSPVAKRTMMVAPNIPLPSPPIFDHDMDIQLDLTEAEHYALYTAMAPHATQIVNGNSIKRKRSAYEDPLNKLRGSLEGQESMINQIMHTTQQYLEPIKTEPRDTVSPLSAHGGISPYGGGILYQAPGTSPYLAASPSASPHYYASPSPDSMNYRYRQEPVNVQGNFDVQMQKEDSTWNIPFQPPNQAPQEYHFNVPAAPPVNDQQIYDLDKHQINSGEVQSLVSQMNIPNMLLADNLSLSDLDINTNPNNTSDSLTNILNEAAKKNLGC